MFLLLLSDCYNLPTSVPFIVNKCGCFVKKIEHSSSNKTDAESKSVTTIPELLLKGPSCDKRIRPPPPYLFVFKLFSYLQPKFLLPCLSC